MFEAHTLNLRDALWTCILSLMEIALYKIQ